MVRISGWLYTHHQKHPITEAVLLRHSSLFDEFVVFYSDEWTRNSVKTIVDYYGLKNIVMKPQPKWVWDKKGNYLHYYETPKVSCAALCNYCFKHTKNSYVFRIVNDAIVSMDVTKDRLKKYAKKYELTFFSWMDVRESGNPKGFTLQANAVPCLFKKNTGYYYNDMDKKMKVHEQVYQIGRGITGHPKWLKNNPPEWGRTKHFYLHLRYVNKDVMSRGGSFFIHPILFKPNYWKGAKVMPPNVLGNPYFKHLERKKKNEKK